MSFEWWHEFLSTHTISESARRVIQLQNERDDLRRQVEELTTRSTIERVVLDLEWKELEEEKAAIDRQVKTMLGKIISKVVRL